MTRLRAVDADLQAALVIEPLAPRVARLRCFRGIDDLTALTIATELGDAARFAGARQVMGFTGLVPSEYSSGATQKRGGITKTAYIARRPIRPVLRPIAGRCWVPRRLAPTSYLTNEKQLEPTTIIIVVAALRFLCPVTLQKRWSVEAVIPAPKEPQRVPVVLSPAEVVRFLYSVKRPNHRAILTTCYAAGLRISEAVHLTIPAIDSQRLVLRVEQGKGQKDRYVMLSPKLLEILREWWRISRPRHWLFSR